MTDALTPEREKEIRDWLDVMLAAQVGTATGAPNYGDMARLLAALDAARAERKLQETIIHGYAVRVGELERVVAALREALRKIAGNQEPHYVREVARAALAGGEQNEPK